MWWYRTSSERVIRTAQDVSTRLKTASGGMYCRRPPKGDLKRRSYHKSPGHKFWATQSVWIFRIPLFGAPFGERWAKRKTRHGPNRRDKRPTTNPRTKNLDFRGFDSSRLSNSKDEIPRSIGNFLENWSLRLLVCGLLLCVLTARFERSCASDVAIQIIGWPGDLCASDL